MSLRLRAARVATAAILATGFALAVSPPAHAVGQTINVWLTTADGANKLTAQSNITLGSVSTGTLNLYVDDSLQYQTVTGFGAAFTDSSTYLLANLKSANPTQYSSLMNYLFTTSGANLNFWRLPMTASDFNSTGTPWTDDDVAGPSNNPTQNFGLTAQDTGHIIPVIQDALAINPNLKIVASPWSAPAWMKDNNSMIGNTTGTPSTLLPQYYQAWADYFRKWIQAYQGQGIPIWGITPQNEPLYSPTNYPGMAWDSAGEASWVHNYLKPDPLPPATHVEVVLQGVDGFRAERDEPVTGVALDRPHDRGVADGGDLLDDGEVAGVEVGVVVTQPAGLSAA